MYFLAIYMSLEKCLYRSSVHFKIRHRRHRFDPGVWWSPGVGNGNPLQYSCLGNSMDRGPWQAIVHGVAKNQTWLKRLNNKYCQILTSIYEHIYNFLATLHGWWDLSSPARDWTWVHGSESPSFNHWTARKSPVWFY